MAKTKTVYLIVLEAVKAVSPVIHIVFAKADVATAISKGGDVGRGHIACAQHIHPFSPLADDFLVGDHVGGVFAQIGRVEESAKHHIQTHQDKRNAPNSKEERCATGEHADLPENSKATP